MLERRWLKPVIVGVVIACIAAGLGGLFFWASAMGLGNLVKTYFLIRTQALAPAPTSTLVEGAIKGMVDALNDPYSVYLDKDSFRELNVQIEGSFGGIGVEFDLNQDKQLVIESVLPGTPASRAGLLSGDIIVQIDGKDATQMSTTRRRQPAPRQCWHHRHYQGLAAAGQPVSYRYPEAGADLGALGKRRDPAGSPGYRLHPGDDFQPGQHPAPIDTGVCQRECKGLPGLILDLRDNPGGDLQTAVELAGYFVPPGPVVRIVNRSGAEEVLRSSRTTKYLTVPLVVLVNGYSASASEIVAGAIKDTGSGTLIGTRTFGKGLVQTVFDLSGQVGVKLTTDKYLTPKGIDINKKGIDPDVVVNQPAGGKPDLQLEKAIQVLQEQIDKTQKQAA